MKESGKSKGLYCTALTSGQFIRCDGASLYCCALRPSKELENKRLLNAKLASPDDYLAGSCIKSKLQERLDRGEFAEECGGCSEREMNGFRSHRQRLNDKWGKFGRSNDLVFLNLELGNKCNLKCVYCNPTFSSSWNEEAAILKDFNLHSGSTFNNDWLNNPEVLNWLIDKIRASSHFKSIEFAGGEPFLSPMHDKILTRLIEEGLSGGIELIYSSNFSLISNAQIDLLKEFGRVELLPSLDSFSEKRFNYIRYPGEVSVVLDQFKRLKDYNFIIRPVLTLSVLNIFEVQRNIEKCREIFGDSPSFGFVHFPNFLHISTLPKNQKARVLESLASVDHKRKAELINQLKVPFIEANFMELRRYLAALDKSRGLDHKRLFEELY